MIRGHLTSLRTLACGIECQVSPPYGFDNMDVYGGGLVSDPASQARLDIANDASATAAVACIPTWETEFRRELPKIDVPLLAVHGDADRILPFPNTGKRLPGLSKGMELVVIEGGPHAIAWTHADQVNQALLWFIDAQPMAIAD